MINSIFILHAESIASTTSILLQTKMAKPSLSNSIRLVLFLLEYMTSGHLKVISKYKNEINVYDRCKDLFLNLYVIYCTFMSEKFSFETILMFELSA